MSDFSIETYKSRITLSIETIKLLVAINGGGAVAVLTFAGHTKLDRSQLWYSLVSYSAGLAIAVSIALAAYIIQALLDEALSEGKPTKFAKWSVFWACIAVVASVAAFTVGSLFAADAISAVRS